MNQQQILGRLGENFAAEILTAKGYELLERNYRCIYGEIDLVARNGDKISFIEVKTRTDSRFGWPGEAITKEKWQKIKKSAQQFLTEKNWNYREVDFEVIEIMVNQISGIGM